ncbi:type II restriction endonuclease (plasmid) [Geobacillus stearothermophilus]|nr:type II restriction endonuclease [Geobacillus stearothermophilus]
MSLDLIKEFQKKIDNSKIDWEVKGLASKTGLFTLGSDSKLIGRIFELIVTPILREIAKENGLNIVAAESQTTYPDFTIMKNEDDKEKIAVDIKTTYRRYYKKKPDNPRPFGFTLGSYASFLRNETKNIHFPYSTYGSHYVIGFVYDRNEKASEGQFFEGFSFEHIESPFLNVEYFIQEKYKIAGEKPGSGNTENIGSILTANIDDFRQGNGPFSVLGKDVFEKYWRNYPKYRESKINYDDLNSFFDWLKEIGEPYEELKDKYNSWLKKVTHN